MEAARPLRFASKVSPAPPCSQVEVVVLPGFRCYLSPCRVCALGVVCLALLKGQSLKYSVKLVETSFSSSLCFLQRFGRAFCFLSLMFRIGIYTFSIAKYSLASLLTGYRVMAMYGFARQDRPNVWNGFV